MRTIERQFAPLKAVFSSGQTKMVVMANGYKNGWQVEARHIENRKPKMRQQNNPPQCIGRMGISATIVNIINHILIMASLGVNI